MNPPKCKLCQAEHWSWDEHVFPSARLLDAKEVRNSLTASNNASNIASNRPNDTSASNKPNASNGKVAGRKEIIQERSPNPGGAYLKDKPTEVEADKAKKQRWGREEYNSYQREYMRKRRAAE